MKRQAKPQLSSSGEMALAGYEQTLLEQEDLAPASIRNYLSDVRHFIAWYEQYMDTDVHIFALQIITTPAINRYRAYLQTDQRQRPASINRSLVSLKRYFGWAKQKQLLSYDPSAPVKLVGQEGGAPRHLDDQEEQALMATVTKDGTLRDRVLIVLLLHTGLRASEICHLRLDQIKLGRRSGSLEVIGKRNKYREVPLNTTARKVLEEYLSALSSHTVFLFPSERTKGTLSERMLGYIVKKYADGASRPTQDILSSYLHNVLR